MVEFDSGGRAPFQIQRAVEAFMTTPGLAMVPNTPKPIYEDLPPEKLKRGMSVDLRGVGRLLRARGTLLQMVPICFDSLTI
jgi:hypothetical protein